MEGRTIPDSKETPLAADISPVSNEPGGRLGGQGPGGWFTSGRVFWLTLAAAVVNAIIPARLLYNLFVSGPGGQIPGIAVLFLLVFGVGALVLDAGLLLLAAILRGRTARTVILVLMWAPVPFELTGLVGEARENMAMITPEQERTGEAWFDKGPYRDVAALIWSCDAGQVAQGEVCDLTRLAAMAAQTDTAKVGPGGESLMSLSLLRSNYNEPNPKVVQIVLRAGKPPPDVARLAMEKAMDMAWSTVPADLRMMHAVLDGGVDPNTHDQAGIPFIFQTLSVNAPVEATASFLDAGARIDEPDDHGYTPLMRAVYYRAYAKVEFLLARGAAEDHVAADGTTMEAAIAQSPPRDGETVPPSVKAFMDRHR
jgi:hypothetical protein